MELAVIRGGSPRGDDDLHTRFTAWLESGASGDPPRAAAVHAAHCATCRAAMMALDDLLVIDPGRAPLPPSGGVRPPPRAALARPRLLAATAASLVVVASAAWIGAGVLAPSFIGDQPEASSADQRVLGAFGAGASATPSPVPSLAGVTSESGGETPTAQPAASETDAVDPTVPPAPATAQPVPITPPPSVGKSAAPTAAPTRTAAPTATPAPTSTPTPTPPPPECSDGVDNDGDGLIDWGPDPLINDPGCLSADDDSEELI